MDYITLPSGIAICVKETDNNEYVLSFNHGWKMNVFTDGSQIRGMYLFDGEGWINVTSNLNSYGVFMLEIIGFITRLNNCVNPKDVDAVIEHEYSNLKNEFADFILSVESLM